MAFINGNNNIITDGLIYCIDASNLQSYIGSGASVQNIVGHLQGSSTFQNNSAENSSPTLNTSPNSWDFAGNKHIKVLPADLFEIGTNDMSFSWWFKQNGTPGSSPYLFASINTGYTDWSRLYMDESGHLNWNSDDGTNPLSSLTGTTNYADNNWHNVTITSIYGGSNHTQNMYVDGQLHVGPDTQADSGVNNTGGIWIGALWPSGNVGGTVRNQWTGDMAFFSVYRKELSASEVLQNYNALKGRFI
jgi:hypothetical protein